MKKEKKKNRFSTFLLLISLAIGLSLLLYPTVSDYWNSLVQSKAVATYAEAVSNMDETQYDAIIKSAQEYNRELLKHPWYHGTGDEVLQVAIGHLNWSSLPVGGPSTHCVISGHRGLPSAKLFTNVDQLREGDTFLLRVLNEILTYEIDTIAVVEPGDTSSLKIAKDKDLCTLVTCTPYGVNSHRLLITGHRVDTVEDAKSVRVIADAMLVEPLLVAPAIAVPILLIIVIVLLIPRKGKKKKEKEKEGEHFE